MRGSDRFITSFLENWGRGRLLHHAWPRRGHKHGFLIADHDIKHVI
jgi:hypothetical protein